jgi:Tetratricopeptide repeat
MAQSSSDRTLMGLLGSDLEEADRADAAEGLPSIDARTEMFLRAVHGPQAQPTAAQRAAARAHILDAMVADLAAETVGLGSEQMVDSAAPATVVPARSSAGWAEIRGRLAESLVKLFAPAGEILALRAVRMAAVPLLALLVVGSIWTGTSFDPGQPESAGKSSSALAPTTRGLVTPTERDLKRDIAAAEVARGPAHPEVASKLADLAALYGAQGRYADAEGLYARALTIQRNALGADHADVLRTTRELAEVYRAQGRGNEADDLIGRAGTR